MAALELANLVRINGVGPAFAHLLRDLGIRGPKDFLATEPHELLDEYERVKAEHTESGAALRVEDIEFCRRFCVRLSSDIEW